MKKRSAGVWGRPQTTQIYIYNNTYIFNHLIYIVFTFILRRGRLPTQRERFLTREKTLNNVILTEIRRGGVYYFLRDVRGVGGV